MRDRDIQRYKNDLLDRQGDADMLQEQLEICYSSEQPAIGEMCCGDIQGRQERELLIAPLLWIRSRVAAVTRLVVVESSEMETVGDVTIPDRACRPTSKQSRTIASSETGRDSLDIE